MTFQARATMLEGDSIVGTATVDLFAGAPGTAGVATRKVAGHRRSAAPEPRRRHAVDDRTRDENKFPRIRRHAAPAQDARHDAVGREWRQPAGKRRSYGAVRACIQ
ncbi:hypothetical protein EMIT0111MI5_40381 [Burkholderia sp. IT-111MI5]